MRTRVALALLFASIAFVGAGARTPPPPLAALVDATPSIDVAPADLAPADLRQPDADGSGVAPGVGPATAAVMWTAPERLLPPGLAIGAARGPALRPRLALACRGARAPPSRTRS